ncbi:hypothetical protein A3B84_01345 [Candidatus Nomurabacteria bacterium RIFCSPHIGHO2_02_FULL_35_13]|uniref:ATP-grasp domain-containing protein n=1 Tax=Candidatus Nomurabacteria bacterium RIFCSPHIGHO2_02_FULL_35_13 TaxID=1801748 RepID=A0A1F6VMQ9_9BACT|nr:MAG: hypothetical protein A3B84_01345 [Candidatus Nomurabacteria bacterium RIFCSPHIGHO2_02_FULL_35_13]
MENKRKKDKIRVGILRGGAGKHYESSLQKGGDIISHIFENLSDKYKIVDILIDKKGDWHINGMPISPADLMRKIDVAWNTSQHPNLSITLDNLSIPSVENGSFLGALENSSDMLKAHIKSIGVQMPRSIVLPLYQKDFSAQGGSASGGDGSINEYSIKKAKEILNKFPAPWIVRSYTPDSNEGIHLAKTFPELISAIEDVVAHEKSVLVEEFISGKIASVHSMPKFRGKDFYTFPLGNTFGNSLRLGEIGFSSLEKEKLINLAKELHRHIGAKHYLKSDFVLHPQRGFFLTGVDFSPDLRKDSHFYQSCEFVGVKMHHVIEHILDRALIV